MLNVLDGMHTSQYTVRPDRTYKFLSESETFLVVDWQQNIFCEVAKAYTKSTPLSIVYAHCMHTRSSRTLTDCDDKMVIALFFRLFVIRLLYTYSARKHK